MSVTAPNIDDVRRLQERLQEWLVLTPVMRLRALEDRLGGSAEIFGKLEFLQQTGTFKARGALSVVLSLKPEQLVAGVTAVSAGNHAIATAYAARAVGVSAKVVMIASASPVRIDACRQYGAEVVLAEDVHAAFALAAEIQQEEGRFFVHPFEGSEIAAGTATVGLEVCQQVANPDSVIIPIGGGGLCAGISSAVKQIDPDCLVLGVEPDGADSMHRSFACGEPQSIDKVATIADSLGAPFALPYSFQLCKDNVDELVAVTDEQIKAAMGILFTDLKIAVEPACAATTAALLGPLRDRFSEGKIVLILCGSNIDWDTYAEQARLIPRQKKRDE